MGIILYQVVNRFVVRTECAILWIFFVVIVIGFSFDTTWNVLLATSLHKVCK